MHTRNPTLSQIPSLSVFIRGCQAREKRVGLLKTALEAHLEVPVQPVMSYRKEIRHFELLLKLSQQIESAHEWILIIEDDMVFSPKLKAGLIWLSGKNHPLVQLSIPSLYFLESSVKLEPNLYFLRCLELHYSGGLFISKEFLKAFLASVFMKDVLGEFWYEHYDLMLSRFAAQTSGGIYLCPSLVGSDLSMDSALGHTYTPTDPFFDHSKAVSLC